MQFLNKIFQADYANCDADTLSVFGFCHGSASVPRGFVSTEVGANDAMSKCHSAADVVDSGKESPKINEQCISLPYM